MNKLRENIGKAINGRREEIYIQGHLCTIWKDNQYKRTRDINETISSFEDLFVKLNTDYIDVGMIHYIDEEKDYQEVFNGEIIKYALKLKEEGKIKYIGISSHNPLVAKKAALSKKDKTKIVNEINKIKNNYDYIFIDIQNIRNNKFYEKICRQLNVVFYYKYCLFFLCRNGRMHLDKK